MFDVFLKEASDWMPEEIVPLDSFVGVDDQHFSNGIFDVGMDPMRKNHRLFFYFFEQVNYIGSSVWHPNLNDWYFPKSIS